MFPLSFRSVAVALSGILFSSLLQSLFLSAPLSVDLTLFALFTLSGFVLPELLLLSSLFGYLVLWGPLLKEELAFFLVLPLLAHFVKRKFLGNSLALNLLLSVLGLIVFYSLIGGSFFLIHPGVFMVNLLLGLLWSTGFFFFIKYQLR